MIGSNYGPDSIDLKILVLKVYLKNICVRKLIVDYMCENSLFVTGEIILYKVIPIIIQYK